MSDLFDIPGDVVAKAEASREFKLTVPESATKSRRDQDTFLWMEAGVITSASSGFYVNEKSGQTVTTMQFTVEINGEGSGLNVNKPLSATMRINAAALKTGEPKGQVTMSNMSIAMMKSLFTALSIAPDLPSGGYSKSLLNSFFPPEAFPGENSDLVGNTIYFQVRQGPREYNGVTRETPEITKILLAPKE